MEQHYRNFELLSYNQTFKMKFQLKIVGVFILLTQQPLLCHRE